MIDTCNSNHLIDDDKVRVTRFDFEPGQETGWHRHGLDYLITAVTDCYMRLENLDGTTEETIVTAGSVYRRQAGIEHNVINRSDRQMIFIEIELK
jgi:beta-alanine degradation protein BauB|tara:strand:+ start:29242 stop:29526 length:285 start_codon:yes stop_codon:yes gene_type:complete